MVKRVHAATESSFWFSLFVSLEFVWNFNTWRAAWIDSGHLIRLVKTATLYGMLEKLNTSQVYGMLETHVQGKYM